MCNIGRSYACILGTAWVTLRSREPGSRRQLLSRQAADQLNVRVRRSTLEEPHLKQETHTADISKEKSGVPFTDQRGHRERRGYKLAEEDEGGVGHETHRHLAAPKMLNTRDICVAARKPMRPALLISSRVDEQAA